MTKYTKYEKGSTWRKWDLHIHTPESIIQNYGNTPENWDKFITALEHLPSEVKVIGITDYYFIDGFEKVMSYKTAGRLQNIEKIFPILEFRIDTFGSGSENKLQKINLHVLFDVDEDNLKSEILKIRTEFIANIRISSTEANSTKKLSKESFIDIAGDLVTGFNSLIPPTKDVYDVLKTETWKNKTFVFLGYKEWSNLEKNNQLKPLKEELYDKTGAFFSSNYSNILKNQQWLNEFGGKKLLHSLDIHDFEQLDTYRLDGDPLTPSINYHCNTWIKADPTFEGLKQIRYEPELRVIIQETQPEDKAGYQVIDKIEINNDLIYNKYLIFNSNMNAIIGGRSTGKSIILRAIANKLNTVRSIEKKDSEYEAFIKNISDTIKVIWKDGIVEDNREIEYFHQGFMHELARNENQLSGLIQDILKKKGKEEIISSYEKWVIENKKVISDLIAIFFQIERDIQIKNQQIRDKGDRKGIEDEIARLTEEQGKLSSKSLTYGEIKKLQDFENDLQEIAEITNDIQNDLSNLKSLKEFAIMKNDLTYEITAITESIRLIIQNEFVKIKQEFETKWASVLDVQIEELNKTLNTSKTMRDSIVNNPEYIDLKNIFRENIELVQYADKIKAQKDKLFEITNLINEVKSLEEQKSDCKTKIVEGNKLYFDRIVELLPQLSESQDGLEIRANCRFDVGYYRDILNTSLNLQSYQNQQIVQFEFKDNIKFDEHLLNLFNNLIDGAITLKGGYTNASLAASLLSECFYYLAYDIKYDGDEFKKMSDGKKAFVVLKLLLDFSEKNCPILIDQPEDDLDNRSIYNDLVKYLRNKKQMRQIILATHNPNIVVGADSELVICANQNGIKNANRESIKFQYVSGSLEHSFRKEAKDSEQENDLVKIILEEQGIREHVCEILEGGEIAFNLRDNKYSLKDKSKFF